MNNDISKPEQLSFFFYEPPALTVKGTIYYDQSKKGVTKFKTRRHNAFRAEVTYNGVKYRKRSTDPEDCKKFLEEMALKYDKGLL